MSDKNDNESLLSEFYRGRNVFITGATGFMGKVLVEKLLRSCPGVSNIYLLIRPKRGNEVKTRFDELLNSTIFDGIRKEHPECLNKLQAISGDITCPQLGISEADCQTLIENISVVFHVAATVKFDEVLKVSVAMNLVGTKRLVELCHKMIKLEALVHVSTAYCNCNRKEIDELVYPPPADPDKIIHCVDWMDEELLNTITPKLIGSRPNTYTFTKALAEHVLMEQRGQLPIAIVRPSIVTAAWKEPVPGWVDNLNGPTGLLAGAGKGVLRTLVCYRELVADFIPVDVAINLLIAVAWHTATSERTNNIIVYNCASGSINPIRWRDIEEKGQECILKNPYNDVLWYPGGSFKNSRLLNQICLTLFQAIPAYLIDVAAWLSGKKPIMVKVHKKFQKAVMALEYFTTHEWKFNSDNVTRLWSVLNDQDKKYFDFNIKNIDWDNYLENYVLGIRVFILKEDLSTIQTAKSHLRKMYILHRATQLFTLMLIWRLVIMRNGTSRRFLQTISAMLAHLAKKVPLSIMDK